jgi:choline dehydrogenase-like flavoprotein
VINERVDVLIIGGGPSGAAMAWSLADTKMRILCLEQGEWPKSDDFPSNGMDWEARQQGDFSINPNVRKNPADYPINDTNSPIKIANFNGVGGGTVLYAAHFPRLLPSDFKVHSQDNIADDWPISYRTLEPFYALNDRIMGTSSLSGDPAYPPKDQILPPLPLGKTGEKFGKAMNKLGWHWWPSDAAILTKEYEGRAPCINLGQCLSGCAQGAKGSADLAYWPEALRARVELKTGCRVSRIESDEDDRATGAYYFDQNGTEIFQPAEIVILACNGIGTPRILLNSMSANFPNGLANSSGLVGKNLMLHPYAKVWGEFDEDLDGHRGPPICLWSMQFYETDKNRGFARGYSYQFVRGQGPARTALDGLTQGTIPWGEGYHQAFHQAFGRSAGVVSICEDLPELTNTVTLDPELTDSNGIPAPKITYKISENTQKMLDHSIAKGTEILKAAGAKNITSLSPMSYAGWHLLGTARMGTDPKASVVNNWGRSHDVKNLFIADGSVFVTSGGVNPTTTIQAISLYIADQIKSRIYDLFD